MKKIWAMLGLLWASIKPDPDFYIASLMWVEGYTDSEIDEFLKKPSR